MYMCRHCSLWPWETVFQTFAFVLTLLCVHIVVSHAGMFVKCMPVFADSVCQTYTCAVTVHLAAGPGWLFVDLVVR